MLCVICCVLYVVCCLLSMISKLIDLFPGSMLWTTVMLLLVYCPPWTLPLLWPWCGDMHVQYLHQCCTDSIQWTYTQYHSCVIIVYVCNNVYDLCTLYVYDCTVCTIPAPLIVQAEFVLRQLSLCQPWESWGRGGYIGNYQKTVCCLISTRGTVAVQTSSSSPSPSSPSSSSSF